MIKLLLGVPIGIAFALWAVIAFISFDPFWILATEAPDRGILFLIWAFSSLGVVGLTS